MRSLGRGVSASSAARSWCRVLVEPREARRTAYRRGEHRDGVVDAPRGEVPVGEVGPQLPRPCGSRVLAARRLMRSVVIEVPQREGRLQDGEGVLFAGPRAAAASSGAREAPSRAIEPARRRPRARRGACRRRCRSARAASRRRRRSTVAATGRSSFTISAAPRPGRWRRRPRRASPKSARESEPAPRVLRALEHAAMQRRGEVGAPRPHEGPGEARRGGVVLRVELEGLLPQLGTAAVAADLARPQLGRAVQQLGRSGGVTTRLRPSPRSTARAAARPAPRHLPGSCHCLGFTSRCTRN